MGKRTVAAVLGLGVAASQAGHLLAYQLRFGAAAQQLQSTGMHSYFPTLAKTILGTAAVALVGTLLLIGLAHVVARAARPGRSSGPSYLNLLAVLFTVQLAWFVGQEVLEAVAAGAPTASASNLLLWGTLGQLPVAMIAATALRWLLSRAESGVDDLLSVVRVGRSAPEPTPLVLACPPTRSLALALSRAAPSAFVKRGPPVSSLIRTF